MKLGLDQRKPSAGRIVAPNGQGSSCSARSRVTSVGLSVGAAGGSVAAHAAGDAGVPSSTGFGLGLALGIGFVVLVLGVVGALVRQTGKLRAEARQLRQRQAHSAALARLLDVWQWRTDAQHRLVMCSAPVGDGRAADPDTGEPLHVWVRFTGVDPLTGLPCTTRHAALRQRLEAQQPADNVLVGLPTGHDTVCLGQLRALPLHDGDGVFLGHVGTVREQAASAAGPVTPAVTAPAELPPTRVAAPDVTAQQAAPMPSLTPLAIPAEADSESFSYTVSHDLRAPIRVVEGFTKIVKEDYGRLLDRVGNDHLDRVLGAAARMNSMIDALLALSQLSAKPVSRQPVNLSQLAGFVVDDLRRQSPQHAVAVHIEPGMQVHGDPTLLRVVLENLLGNAWKYTGKCANPQVWFERCTDTATPSFTVRDNGAGFDMRFADRLFGVFQRLHSASEFQGTGIGLASVRRIVHKHGGEVWAESEVGRGASFHFSVAPLPI